MATEPTVAALGPLFHQGHARFNPEALDGALSAGLCWCSRRDAVVATPALLRLGAEMAGDGERVGLLLAAEPRFRAPWLDFQALRLADLGRREEVAELCREIDALGPAAKVLRSRIDGARRRPSSEAAVELALFGAPADQGAAAPGLLRVLGLTAPRIEGGQGAPAAVLPPVDPYDPEVNWVAGRLLQAPRTAEERDPPEGSAVLHGGVSVYDAGRSGRMSWVLSTPWVTLLAVLVFTAEAWAAERRGGLRLELPERHVQRFARPPEVEVVVTLADGREVLCGTLGELCLRCLDALGMALVPAIGAGGLDARLAAVVAELLRGDVWQWKPETRTHYVIGEAFGFDCYRGEGHRYIFLGADHLSQTLRSVAVSWARDRVDGHEEESPA